MLFGQKQPELPATVWLQVRSQPPVDILDTLQARHQQGSLSGTNLRRAHKWLVRLNNALFEKDAGQFNKAKSQLLQLCQPAAALVLQVPERHVRKLQDLDIGKLDLSGVRVQTESGLPIRALNNHLYPATLSSPEVSDLPDTATQKQAEHLLLAMSGHLEREDGPGFTQTKKALFRLFNTHGVEITAQNPLVLNLQKADALSNKILQGLDLSNLALMPPEGQSLELKNTSLLHCNLQNTWLYRARFDNAMLIGNHMRSTWLEGARFTDSVVLLNRMDGASLEHSDFSRSDVLLNEIYRSNLSAMSLLESDLSLNRLGGSQLEGVSLDRATARFNVVPQGQLGLNDNSLSANAQLAKAIQRDTIQRLETVWFNLTRALSPVPIAPETPEQLDRFLYRNAASSDMVLPPRMKQRKFLRGLTNLFISPREVPNFVQQRHPYAELAGILPVWAQLMDRLPYVDSRQTPLGDPAFLPSLTQRLRQQKLR